MRRPNLSHCCFRPRFTLPESLAAEMKAIGPVPKSDAAPGALDR